ncbi:MAG TPA: nickel-dependent hydrogenase large subunit [Burkholderiaceae bacterium]|nr:nickel-dependent hydrogenase large subunit [Burkholderiaceae bacterium]
MSLEGELHIGLRLQGGRIAGVRVRSTRPDVARALLAGRSRTAVAATVPQLFAVCARSQAVACDLACAAAAGETVTGERLQRGAMAVATEWVRECAWRTLLTWPQAIDETPSADALAAARLARHFSPDSNGDGEAIARTAFGCSAADWLARQTLPELDRWIDAGATAAARFVREVRDEDAAAGITAAAQPHAMQDDGAAGAAGTRWLAAAGDTAALNDLLWACDDDPAFARHPTWYGATAETGALARQRGVPLMAALLARSHTRMPARFVARLRELALWLGGRGESQLGAQALPDGRGIGWVENARGLLAHCVRMNGERVTAYALVAPTDWNFHPAGALSEALASAAVADAQTARRLATRTVDSLDPCVVYRVEVDDA